MISPELAKELREAGYGYKTDWNMYDKLDKQGLGVIGLPKLDELIEALEALPNTGTLYLTYTKEDGLWSVDTSIPGKWAHSKFEHLDEAAARLWLALNKKTV